MDDIDTYLSQNRRYWSANTFDRYQRSLRLFRSEVANIDTLSAAGLLAWLDSHSWGSSTIWVNFTAVKKFLSWRYGFDHPALNLRIKRSQPPPQRSLSLEQVQTLLSSFDTTGAKGRRDLAICGILLDCALRASELCGLQLRHLDLDNRTLIALTKGGKWSNRVFSDYTATWLAAWLSDREKLALSNTVFISLGGNSPGHALTREGLQTIMRYWARAVGLPALSPHDFRRTYGSLTTLAGAPEDVAMKGGGWSSHDVFRRYTVGVTPRSVHPYLPTKKAMEDD